MNTHKPQVCYKHVFNKFLLNSIRNKEQTKIKKTVSADYGYSKKSIKSTFLAFCHVFKKNKKVFVSLIVVCVVLLGGGIYAKVNYDINHAYDGIWNIEGDLEGNYFDIRGDDVAFFETNRG